MKRHTTLYMAAACTIVLLHCAKAPPTLSPSGEAAFQATRVVRALDLLRDIAVEAEAQQPKLLSTDSARKVVLYHRSALRAIEAVPGGWKDVVLSRLEEVMMQLGTEERRHLQPYAALLQTLVAEVTK